MISAEHMDYGALKWVKGEIEVNLQQAQQALEVFQEHPAEAAQIDLCITLLHQVRGALQMLDLTEAYALAREMEQAVRVLAKDADRRKGWVYGTLMRAMSELPLYLTGLQEAQADRPQVFLPLINDLRVATGASVLSESMVFGPAVIPTVSPHSPDMQDKLARDIKALAHQLRPVYQAGLLVWYRDAGNKAALRRLLQVTVQLQQVCPEEGLWRVSEALIERLLAEMLEPNDAIKLLLGQVERQIGRVMAAGAEELRDHPPADLIKNMLYYIAYADTHNEQTLDMAVSASANMPQHVHGGAVASNPGLLEIAADAVKDELAWAKTKLDGFARAGGRHTPQELRVIAGVLARVSNTLDMLGRWELRQRVRQQTGVLDTMLESGAILNDPRLLEVANALLYVESLLRDVQMPDAAASGESAPGKPEAVKAGTAEHHDLCRAVIREIMVDMGKVKDDIIALAKAPGQHELIGSAPSVLHRIIGSLKMLSLERPAGLLKAGYHYIRRDLIERRITPSLEALDTLADMLTGIEFYLDTLAESQMNLDSLLDLAESNAVTLGYPVDTVDDYPLEAVIQAAAPDEPAVVETISLAASADEFISQQPDSDSIVPDMDSAGLAEDPAMAGAIETVQSLPVARTQEEEDADEVMEVFIEEVGEELTSIAQHYPQWKQETNNHGALKNIRRSFHTLKGSGRLVGANVIGEVAWAIEHLLNKVIDGEIPVTLPLFDVVEHAQTAMPGLLQQFQRVKTKMDIDEDIQALIDQAQALTSPAVILEEHVSSVSDVVTATQQDVAVTTLPVEQEAVIDPVLLDIFRTESRGRLEEVRRFIDACGQAKKGQVTEPLVRNLHTLQGSAHMAGFKDIGDLGGLFEKLVNTIHRNNGEVAEAELLALSDFSEVFHEMLHLENPLAASPEKTSALEKISFLTRRAQHLLDAAAIAMAVSPETGVPNALNDGAPGSDSDEVREIFLEEAAEILGNTESLLQSWMRAPDVLGPVARLERELHTFKGGARMAGISAMGDLSHSFESLLSAIVAGDIAATDEIFETFQQAHDRLQTMLEPALLHLPVAAAPELIARMEALARHKGIESATPSDTPLVGSIVDAVDIPTSIASETPLSVDATTAPEDATAEPAWLIPKPSTEQIRVRADLLDNLVNQAGELSISRSRLEQQINAFHAGLTEMKQTVVRLRDQLRKLDMETEAQILFRHQEAGLQGQDFDPLEFDRFSMLQQLSRSMMESTADLASIQDQLEKQAGDSEAVLLQQARLNTGLQEGMMRTRMLPFTGMASRLRRVVRQTAREVGKAVELQVIGEDLEMDRTVLDRMAGPLEHMIRNAVDHGIEDAATRCAQDKPEMGVITLQLAREGTEMLLHLADDGRGLDLAAIRRKAIERGLLGENTVIDDYNLMQFVLESGFSTAVQVTQISGRGVGMDVVNNEIKQLGGSLQIESVAGSGSRFTVRLPVALSITQALIVGDGEQMYAIPHSSIDGVMRVSYETLAQANESGASTFEYGGAHYSLQSLSGLLSGGGVSPLPEKEARHLLLMVHGSGQRVALRVNSVMENREIVVKSLGPQLSTVRGIMGATIMGDGGVVLILDIPVLLRMGLIAEQSQRLMPEAKVATQGAARSAGSGIISVMVVDDSITVRKVTSRLLERNQMRVLTAKDGVDALEALQHQIPDVMLLDIEMPRMDGYELASVIRNDERLKHIPIIMITSRTGEKHREHARRIGVNEYLGKPYQENELLDHIRTLAGGQTANNDLSIAV
ncbi:MAG: Hpt domain-containing protein [Gammaproteobacteria bacterium]|nr:Hpt domain-containing protein [Gammaproteobacteria bacterium]